MCSIYILKLEDGCFYVGKTNNINERINAHKAGNGSEWTRLHKFVSIYKILYEQDDFEEDKQVKKLMAHYGIDKVRGGAYSTINLTQMQKDFINKEIVAAQDLCYNCQKPGHFSNNCPIRKVNLSKKAELKHEDPCNMG